MSNSIFYLIYHQYRNILESNMNCSVVSTSEYIQNNILTLWYGLYSLRPLILLEYCLKKLMLNAGPNKDCPGLVRAHNDWPFLVSIYFLPQLKSSNSHVMGRFKMLVIQLQIREEIAYFFFEYYVRI